MTPVDVELTPTEPKPTQPKRGGPPAGLKAGLGVVAGVLSVGLALMSYRYVANIGPIPTNVALNAFLKPWIVVHAGAAATALLSGPFQFVKALRRRWPQVHRWVGRVYVTGCLLGGASGLVLAAGVSTGPMAQTGFAALAILWICVTVMGWRSARGRRFAEHERWMVRSFALTFAAVTLRLYIPIILALGLDFSSGYRAIAWLAWVPNAMAAELYLRRRPKA